MMPFQHHVTRQSLLHAFKTCTAFHLRKQPSLPMSLAYLGLMMSLRTRLICRYEHAFLRLKSLIKAYIQTFLKEYRPDLSGTTFNLTSVDGGRNLQTPALAGLEAVRVYLNNVQLSCSQAFPVDFRRSIHRWPCIRCPCYLFFCWQPTQSG